VNEAGADVSPFSIGPSGSLSSITCSAVCTVAQSPYWLAITPNGRFLYVSNYTADTVSPYSIGSTGTLTRIACASATCTTDNGPEDATVTPNGKYLYVTSSADSYVTAFSIASTGSLKKISCGSCTTGSYPWTSAVTPNGKFLYVLNDESASISPFAIHSNGSLTPISCSTGCSAGKVSGTPFASAYGLVVSPNGRFVYTVNYTDERVEPHSVNLNGSLTAITCSPSSNCSTGGGSAPTSVTMSPNGSFLDVVDAANDKVVVFSVAANGSISPVTCSTCGGLDERSSNTYGQGVVAAPDQAPTASFAAAAGLVGHPSAFNASTSKAAAGQTVASYAWSFGDGSHATGKTAKISHTYKTAGTYTVTLTVKDNAGCSTAIIFTGQTAYCNGGPHARMSRKIVIK
jgi:6-phosphogluconolactonase (cycloisomerase 2 family)